MDGNSNARSRRLYGGSGRSQRATEHRSFRGFPWAPCRCEPERRIGTKSARPRVKHRLFLHVNHALAHGLPASGGIWGRAYIGIIISYISIHYVVFSSERPLDELEMEVFLIKKLDKKLNLLYKK
jgi:hypothetical protein